MDRARHFPVVCSNRTRDKDQKLEHKKFHTNMRKKLFTVRITEHCNREDVGSSSLEILKT